jgi:hypothetical protein
MEQQLQNRRNPIDAQALVDQRNPFNVQALQAALDFGEDEDDLYLVEE